MRTPATLPVTVVSGVDAPLARDVARGLLRSAPSGALVTHNLDQVGLGLVARTIERSDGDVEPAIVELAHGCLSCTLRLDVLPTLVRLAQDGRTEHAVLLLPPNVEPVGFVEAFYGVLLSPDGLTAARTCHLERIVTVVDGDRLVERLEQDEPLADLELGAAFEDDRTLAQLLARQAETADVVVAPHADATALAVLQALNPGAVVGRHLPELPGPGRRRLDLDHVLDKADTSLVPAGPARFETSGAWHLVWRARRPLHPARLNDALPSVVGRALRARGSVWLATRPDARVGWESAGPRVLLGEAGRWIADGGAAAWSAAEPSHRARAQLDWDPTYADRYQELALTGAGDLPEDLLALLDSCLLDEHELEAGPFGPPLLHDPLADVFAPDDDGTDARQEAS